MTSPPLPDPSDPAFRLRALASKFKLYALDIAELCEREARAFEARKAQPKHAPETVALLERLETRANLSYDTTCGYWDPKHGDDLRQAIQLIRFGPGGPS